MTDKRIDHEQHHVVSRNMMAKVSSHRPGIYIRTEWTTGWAAETVAEFDAAAAKVRAEIIDGPEGEAQ